MDNPPHTISYLPVVKPCRSPEKPTSGFNIDSLFVVICLISIILVGAMEGLLMHLLCVFLLKRFKIKDLGTINIYNIKPNIVIGYVSFLSSFALLFRNYINNQTIKSIILVVSIIGMFILIYYAYLFLVCYGALVLKKNIAIFVILLALFVPMFLTALIVIGFLYAAGPLRTYLEEKVNSINHE